MFAITEMEQCQNIAVPLDVMQHVVQIESSFNPYAIGVVGGQLVRQPKSLAEAISTAEMLEQRGYNFSVGLAQVNRYNLSRYGLNSYAQAFDGCTSLRTGAKILSECQVRARGDWGKAFSCYYSGNFTTGYEHGYVRKVLASIDAVVSKQTQSGAIPLAVAQPGRASIASSGQSVLERRVIGRTVEAEALLGSVPVAAEKRAGPVTRAVAESAETLHVLQAGGDAPRSSQGALAASTLQDQAESTIAAQDRQLAEADTARDQPPPADNAFVF